jgi:hypothetical protein
MNSIILSRSYDEIMHSMKHAVVLHHQYPTRPHNPTFMHVSLLNSQDVWLITLANPVFLHLVVLQNCESVVSILSAFIGLMCTQSMCQSAFIKSMD